MEVKFKAATICKIEIDEGTAFSILCQALGMDFVMDEDKKFIIKPEMEDGYIEKHVYVIRNGGETKYDDRGRLFIALRNVAVCLFPDCYFRGESYINQLEQVYEEEERDN
mgnify:CR=1 FL=1